MHCTLNPAFSCAFWQSEEDKQLQDELEMLVERLGVSLCCVPQQGVLARIGLCLLLMDVPSPVEVGGLYLEWGEVPTCLL